MFEEGACVSEWPLQSCSVTGFYLQWDLDPSANAEVKDGPFSLEGKTHRSYAFIMLES